MFIPHLAAYDLVPWPKLRDHLISSHPHTQPLFALVLANLVVEWLGTAEDLFTWDFDTGLPTGVAAGFVQHVKELGSWGAKERVLVEGGEELGGLCRIVGGLGEAG